MANLIFQLDCNYDIVSGEIYWYGGGTAAAGSLATQSISCLASLFGAGSFQINSGDETAANPLVFEAIGPMADRALAIPAFDSTQMVDPSHQLQGAHGGTYTQATRAAAPSQPATALITLTDGPGGSPNSGTIGVDGVYFSPVSEFPGGPNWSLGSWTSIENFTLNYNTPGYTSPSPPSVDLSNLLLSDDATYYTSDGGTYSSTLTYPGNDPVNQQDTLVVTGTTGGFTITTDAVVTAGIGNDGNSSTIQAALTAAGVSYTVVVSFQTAYYATPNAPRTYVYLIEFQNGTPPYGGTPPTGWAADFSGLTSPITVSPSLMQYGVYVAPSSGGAVIIG